MRGGTEDPGIRGTLRSASIIDGPLGKTCQIDFVDDQSRVGILTELHEPGNTPRTPRPIWLMTCNHDVADQAAEATG